MRVTHSQYKNSEQLYKMLNSKVKSNRYALSAAVVVCVRGTGMWSKHHVCRVLFHVTEDTVKTPLVSLFCCVVSGGAGERGSGTTTGSGFVIENYTPKELILSMQTLNPGPPAQPLHQACPSPGGPSSGG